KLGRVEEETRRDKFDDFEPDSMSEVCAPGPKSGSVFPRRFTLNVAVVALRDWVEKRVPAPSASRIERVGPVPDSPTKKLARDRHGNAIGGFRSPIIQAPVGSYDGEACVAAGTTIALPPARLTELYAMHAGYVQRLLAATNRAVEDRLLLCED